MGELVRMDFKTGEITGVERFSTSGLNVERKFDKPVLVVDNSISANRKGVNKSLPRLVADNMRDIGTRVMPEGSHTPTRESSEPYLFGHDRELIILRALVAAKQLSSLDTQLQSEGKGDTLWSRRVERDILATEQDSIEEKYGEYLNRLSVDDQLIVQELEGANFTLDRINVSEDDYIQIENAVRALVNLHYASEAEAGTERAKEHRRYIKNYLAVVRREEVQGLAYVIAANHIINTPETPRAG
jgi:hypothetical protein